MADDDDTQATQATMDELKRRAQQATAGVTTQPAGGTALPSFLKNPFPEKEAQEYLQAESKETESTLGELRDIRERTRAIAGQRIGAPGAPRLEQPPKAPEVPIADSLRVFQNPAVLMMTLGSLFTKTPAITALKAGAAAMDGYAQGNQEAYDRLRQIWKDKTEEVRDRNQYELERNNAAWKATEHNARERLAQLHALAIEHQDVVQEHNLREGRLDNWWGLQTMRMKAGQHFNDSLLKYEISMNRTAAAQRKADEKFREKDETRKSTVNDIDLAIKLVQDGIESGNIVTGVRGHIGRAWEWAFGGGEDQARFEDSIRRIQMAAPTIIRGSSRMLAADRARLDTIVPGLGFMRNPEQVLAGLKDLRTVLSRGDLLDRDRAQDQPEFESSEELQSKIQEAIENGFSKDEINEFLSKRGKR